MYSGKESSPLGLGIAAEPLALGIIQEGRDKTNWIVTLKNGVKVWSRITRLSEINNNTEENATNPKDEAISVKKKSATAVPRKKASKKDDNTKGDDNIQDNALSRLENKENQEDTKNEKVVTKRKPTNYNIYMKYKLKQLAKENNNMKPKERIAHAVSLWQSMDDTTKKDIIEKARKAIEDGEI